jgi:nicotinamide riboside kinase
MRRVVLTGGECTGKTTLARALSARWGTTWAAEAAREVALTSAGVLGPEDVPVIARTHVRLADAAARAAGEAGRPVVFLDQDLFSTAVYAWHYYGDCPQWIERLAAERRGDLYLLCAPDLPWESDGVRDRPGDPRALHARPLRGGRARRARRGARRRAAGGRSRSRRADGGMRG